MFINRAYCTYLLCVGVLAIASLLFVTQTAHAQLPGLSLPAPVTPQSALPAPGSFSGIESNVSFPSPFETITLSAKTFAFNTHGAAFEWYLNGEEMIEHRNKRAIEVTVGALGQQMDFEVHILAPGEFPVILEYSITPTIVDIILEADTYVPHYYQGRALPSSQSTIRAVAVSHIGTDEPRAALSYDWRLDGEALNIGPIRGGDSVEFETSQFRDSRLAVTVLNSNGTPVARESVLINPVEPEIHFYEDNPLTGIEKKSIGDDFFLFNDESNIVAEPFYFDRDSQENDFVVNWRLNGRTVENTNLNPYYITFRKEGVGRANVDLQVVNRANLVQNARDGFRINFE